MAGCGPYSWIAKFKVFYYLFCQRRMTIQATHSDTRTYAASLTFMHDRRGGWFVFMCGGSIESERSYNVKDSLFVRHERVKINENITCDRIGMCTLHSLYISQDCFYITLSLSRPAGHVYTYPARKRMKHTRHRSTRNAHVRTPSIFYSNRVRKPGLQGYLKVAQPFRIPNGQYRLIKRLCAK